MSTGGTSRLDSIGGAAALFGDDSDSKLSKTKAFLNPTRRISKNARTLSQVYNPSDSTSISSEPSSSRGGFVSLAMEPESGSSVAHFPPAPGSEQDRTAQESVQLPDPRSDDEDTTSYLSRALQTVDRPTLLAALSTHDTSFHQVVLQKEMERFDWHGISFDFALREVLAQYALPKETQQIDRVLNAFAHRYSCCNPGLFVSTDQAYITAFSLIMLHTDHYNPNNRKRMDQASYVRNTKGLSQLPAEILEVSTK